jgi:hypothetical protein
VQILSSVSSLYGDFAPTGDTTTSTWKDVDNFTVDPDGNDGFELRFTSPPYTQSGRIIYQMENTVLPTGSPTVSTTINSSITTLIIALASMPELYDSGFMKIETEWMAYNNLDRGASTFTTDSLVRAFYGTTAASHASTTAISFGVGVDNPQLWNQMQHQVAAYVHQLNVQKSTGEDSTRHQQLMSYHQQIADDWWRRHGYVGQRKGRLKLGAGALGPQLW